MGKAERKSVSARQARLANAGTLAKATGVLAGKDMQDEIAETKRRLDSLRAAQDVETKQKLAEYKAWLKSDHVLELCEREMRSEVQQSVFAVEAEAALEDTDKVTDAWEQGLQDIHNALEFLQGKGRDGKPIDKLSGLRGYLMKMRKDLLVLSSTANCLITDTSWSQGVAVQQKVIKEVAGDYVKQIDERTGRIAELEPQAARAIASLQRETHGRTKVIRTGWNLGGVLAGKDDVCLADGAARPVANLAIGLPEAGERVRDIVVAAGPRPGA